MPKPSFGPTVNLLALNAAGSSSGDWVLEVLPQLVTPTDLYSGMRATRAARLGGLSK